MGDYFVSLGPEKVHLEVVLDEASRIKFDLSLDLAQGDVYLGHGYAFWRALGPGRHTVEPGKEPDPSQAPATP